MHPQDRVILPIIGAAVGLTLIGLALNALIKHWERPKLTYLDEIADYPVDQQQIMLLYQISKKLTSVNIVATILLIGWIASCLFVAFSTILGTGLAINSIIKSFQRFVESGG